MNRVRMLFSIFACGFPAAGLAVAEGSAEPADKVNIYSHRHYDTDQALYELFEEQTGISVNVIHGRTDELIERLSREGAESPADILMTIDAGRLVRAQSMGLLQPTTSVVLTTNVPDHLRDPAGHWFGLTQRARVIVYHPDRVSSEELSTYADLAHPKWKGRVLIRSSSNIYNQSLLASIIANEGKTAATAWAAGMVANFARTPRGNDRDQMKAIVAGEGDLAIVNTYYIGRLINSADEHERKVGAQVRVFFPDQENRGSHVNISGAGITTGANNYEHAVKLIEFLTSAEVQERFSAATYEYPVNPAASLAPLLKSWGAFTPDDLSLNRLGELNAEAVRIFDHVGWR